MNTTELTALVEKARLLRDINKILETEFRDSINAYRDTIRLLFQAGYTTDVLCPALDVSPSHLMRANRPPPTK